MQFISKLFGFNLPGSESSMGIIALYIELCLYSFLILYVIIDIICGIVIEFKEPYFEGKKILRVNGKRTSPLYFTSKMESFLDIFFLILPTSIIIYLLVPTLGYLYNNEIVGLQTAFTINIIGHQ
jgi:hypothetical protein